MWLEVLFLPKGGLKERKVKKGRVELFPLHILQNKDCVVCDGDDASRLIATQMTKCGCFEMIHIRKCIQLRVH
jgi:hypothetical protein